MAVGRRSIGLARAMAAGLSMAIGMLVAEGISTIRLESMRVPIPRVATRFPDPPGDRIVDVVVLGESSACGVPFENWLSVGEVVAWKLREALPGRAFRLTNLARPGVKLDEVHQTLGWLERRPDLVILYAGHNEFSMRYDWAHGPPHYLDETPPSRVTLAGLVGRYSRVCRVIEETTGLLLRASPPRRTAARRLVDVPVYTAAEYAERLHDFRVRIEAITSHCEGLGAMVVLLIPPGNDADFEPSRSFLPPETPRADREAFARNFEAARRLEPSDPVAAVGAYRDLLSRQPGFAEAHYRLARLLERSGRRDEARRHYVAARDRDGLPLRCPSDFQDVYRDVAARHLRAILIDGPAILGGLDHRGTAGDLAFIDGFHPSLVGYAALVEAILRGLHARRAFGWGEAATSAEPSLSADEVARHFGIGPDRWRAVCDFAAMFYSRTADVRYDADDRLAKADRYHGASLRIRAGAAPEDVGIPGVGTGPSISR
jgi:lysophospholipase L1-like esterase